MTQASAQEHTYDDHDLEVSRGFTRYREWMMRPFLPHLRGKVIEVGAGIGSIAERYVDGVDDALLVEPAASLHAKLARKFASNPKVRTAEAFLGDTVGKEYRGLRVADASFDAAIMVDVLEHIEDDVGTLRTLHRLLKPGGKLLVFVPALPILYGAIDAHIGHFRRYTRTTLEKAIRAADFRIDSTRYFDLLGMLPWFVTGRVLRRTQVGEGGVAIYDRVVIPVCQVVDRLTGPKIGKNLITIATKPA